MVKRRSRKPANAIALLWILCMCTTPGCNRPPEEAARQAQYSRGKKIFLGNENAPARIAGHQDPLPARLARCVNCHASARPLPANAESAPPLTRTALLQTRPRRGGPAFAYEQESFCNTLRLGIDPEHVVLNRAMPRYDMGAEQCQALWLYLTEKRKDENQ